MLNEIDDLIKILKLVKNHNEALNLIKKISVNVFFDEDEYQKYYGRDEEDRRKIGIHLKNSLLHVIDLMEKGEDNA